MAGDWIQVKHSLPTTPEMAIIADRLREQADSMTEAELRKAVRSWSADVAIGRCVRAWIWADRHGARPRVTPAALSKGLGAEGHIELMIAVGWVREHARTLVFVKFDRHLSQTAKQKALARRRMRMLRAQRNISATSAQRVDTTNAAVSGCADVDEGGFFTTSANARAETSSNGSLSCVSVDSCGCASNDTSTARKKTKKEERKKEPKKERRKNHVLRVEQLIDSTTSEREELERVKVRVTSRGAGMKKIVAAFDKFWAAYPTKVAKLYAAACYQRAVERLCRTRKWSVEQAELFLADRAAAFARSDAGRDQKRRLHPSTFLNQGRYDDDESAWARSDRPAADPAGDFPTDGW